MHAKRRDSSAESRILVLDPYAGIDWEGVGRHRAGLHLHTLQSDGYQMVEEVVRTYRRHGFSILAITDHDWNRPNARILWKHLPPEVASPYPKEPYPENYPANPTWPWTDYGCPAPEELGLIGIQGNELTFRHHINSYFCDYGVWYERTGPAAPYGGIVDSEGNDVSEDDQIAGIQAGKGLAVINHPGIDDKHPWWDRKPLEWYVERFRRHPASCLVGVEVTNCESRYSPYDEGVWDQLLARYMPWRPVWGFGSDDMHKLEESRQTFTTFFLDEPSAAAVRRAMFSGRFCFSSSTQGANYRDESFRMVEFPVLKAVTANPEKGTISLCADNCGEVRWIAAPESLEPTEDFRTSNAPWPQGQVVHVGDTLDFRNTPGIGSYVRAELVREEGNHLHRTFTNPFGFACG